MAKKTSKSSASKRSSKKVTKKRAAKKSTAKKTTTRKAAARSAPKRRVVTSAPVVEREIVVQKHQCYHEPTEEHRVFSHVMYIMFLISGALAAIYTFRMLSTGGLIDDPYTAVKALVMLGWAFLFKTFAHRIHHPHH